MASSLYKFQVALSVCENHNKKEPHAYCKTCEMKICSLCIEENHHEHDWETLIDILWERKRSLPEECKGIRANKLPGLRKEITRLNRKIQIEDVTLEQNKSVLNNSRQNHIATINKIFDDRINECQRMHDETVQVYKDNHDRLKQKVEYLEIMTTALDTDINSLPDNDILDMEKEMREELEKALSYSADKYTCTTMFVPGQMKVQSLEKMIGEIQSVTVDETNDIDMHSYAIYSINPVSDTKSWIRKVNDKYAQLIDRNNQEKKKMSISCQHITICKNGEFVITNESKCLLSVLTKDENKIRSIDTKPLIPIYICKTENDDILVTLRDNGDDYNLVPTSRRLVKRMNLTGTVLHTYEFKEDGRTRLFTWPIRMTENKNTDLCVVNRLSRNSGELIVLHKDGLVKFTYRGDGLVFENFLPVDIECDDKCRILLAEGYSRAIQILSAEGMYLCTLCQYEEIHPSVISIYGDNLWSGFYEGRVKVFKYFSN